jgi:hypothetical protein
MAGNRIFHLSLEGVKHFLESVFSDTTELSTQNAYPDKLYSAMEC